MRTAHPSLIGDALFFRLENQLQIFPIDGEAEVVQEARAEQAVHIRSARKSVVDTHIQLLDDGGADTQGARPRERYRDSCAAHDIAAHPRRAVCDLEARALRELRRDQRLA